MGSGRASRRCRWMMIPQTLVVEPESTPTAGAAGGNNTGGVVEPELSA